MKGMGGGGGGVVGWDMPLSSRVCCMRREEPLAALFNVLTERLLRPVIRMDTGWELQCTYDSGSSR